MSQSGKIRIGIPRALLYHQLFPVWKAFFDELGFDVITSGETTEEIIRKGINSTGSDLCLPVKTFLGHIHEIKDSVDFLFVPRYISIEEDSYMCPKFLGLPDMVRATVNNLPPLIDSPMNLKKGGVREFLDGIRDILRIDRIDRRDIEDVYRNAEKLTNVIARSPDKYRDDEAIWHEVSFRGRFDRGISSRDCHGLRPRNDLSGRIATVESTSRGINLKIALLGRPYLLYDPCINRSLIEKIDALGADIKIRDMLSKEEIKEVMNLLPKPLYWSMGKEVVASAYFHAKHRDVDGIINLVSVACGPDSFTSEIINELRKSLRPLEKTGFGRMQEIPYMTLYLDEHTSDTGILTRIEAFIDMIKRRKACPGDRPVIVA